MGKLFELTTNQPHLFQAWKKIRENGYLSSLEETRRATEVFDQQANTNIIRLQKSVRANAFVFLPQTGVAKTKASGGKRGIVMAPVQNRIIERAILDTLQAKSNFVKSVITMPTSVGGVPDRSVPHGLKLIKDAIEDGYCYFARSDISKFFDDIPRRLVLEKIASDVDDQRFLKLIDEATTVTLLNEKALGEDRHIFPTTEEGVAQGSPLSPLFGNILLYDFDKQFNGDGVICIRFIDDFILMSKDKFRVEKAFKNAKAHLEKLGLTCHDPFDPKASREKAQAGEVKNGFSFLGYDIEPGLFQPSSKAREQLLKAIRERIKTGKKCIVDVKQEPHSENTQRYSQTMVGIDRVIRGWGDAFAYHNSPSTIEQLDEKIDKHIDDFRNWYADLIRTQDKKNRRRTGGVCLLSDIKSKQLDDVPFKIVKNKRFVQSSKSITISTDGSVVGSKRSRKDKGPGGWAYVVHETGAEYFGSQPETTNNRMELTAVIEAIKATPIDKSVSIRTDSRYVETIANGIGIAKSNSDLWKEFQKLIQGRAIKITWVKGHAGNEHNERADLLANQQAIEAFKQKKFIT